MSEALSMVLILMGPCSETATGSSIRSYLNIFVASSFKITKSE